VLIRWLSLRFAESIFGAMVLGLPPETIQAQVRQRAKHLCEFCHADEMWQYVRFNVDHVMPLSLGGDDSFGIDSLGFGRSWLIRSLQH
jgi:hypothetical protein